MALQKNTFTPLLNAFHEELADLNAYQFFVNGQLKRAKASFERSLDVARKDGWHNGYFAGTSLSLLNIFHDGEWMIRAPLGKRIAQGDDLLRMTQEMQGRFNSFILVSMFESLEKYLKSMYGEMLFQLRAEVRPPNQKAFHKVHPKKHKNTQPYYVGYAAHTCRRGCDEALREFRKHLDWGLAVIEGPWGMTWEEAFVAFEFCRHRIVHDYGRIDWQDRHALNKPQQDFVKRCIGKSLHSGENCLLIPTEVLDMCLDNLASYGWGLYILVSKRCMMADDTPFFRPSDGGKRKVKPH